MVEGEDIEAKILPTVEVHYRLPRGIITFVLLPLYASRFSIIKSAEQR